MDFDILILPNSENAKLLMNCLDDFGFGGVSELREELFCQRGTVFSLGVQPNQIDLLTSISTQSEIDVFENKIMGKLESFDVYYVSLEDLLRAKKEAGRLKDLLDIEELRKVND
ncbi:MAG: hypothetical protein MK132_04750 [Lentisphaerales bacterium]|nr:hypothetical protein [Lentisphaerales bacterium]